MARFNEFYKELDLTTLHELCLSKGAERVYGRGEKFLCEGEVCRKIALIKSGYFRYSTHQTNGGEGVVGFSFAGEYLADMSNSLAGTPAPVSITAGKVSEVLEISVDDFLTMCSEDCPELLTSMMLTLFRTLYRRFTNIYRFSPKERYLELARLHPQLLQEVPLRDIASYLQISPIHLSRIRRELIGK